MSLLVVVPICQHDTDLAERLLQHCAHPDDAAHQYPALVVLSATLRDESDKWLSLAKKAFQSATLLVMEKEDNLGWPAAPNYMFRTTVNHLAVTGNKNAFFWLEPDNVPVTRDWLTRLYTEYNQAQKPYMGAKERTRMVDRKTGVFQKYDGYHINGSAIYPRDFHNRSLLWKFAVTEAWDVYCRWEIAPAAHATDSMVSRWRSRNYSKQGGKLVFERHEAHQDDLDIPDAALVIHGCKDFSLFDALWPSGAVESKSAKPAPTISEVVDSTPAPKPAPKAPRQVVVLEDE